jgi:hypothetical protein
MRMIVDERKIKIFRMREMDDKIEKNEKETEKCRLDIDEAAKWECK